MKYLRDSSFDEFAIWFFEREHVKNEAVWPKERFDSYEKRLDLFRSPAACGKFHEPFLKDSTRWTIQQIDSQHELEILVTIQEEFLINDNLKKTEDPFLLGVIASHAINTGYFNQEKKKNKSHLKYYQQLKKGELKLKDKDRLVLITLNFHPPHIQEEVPEASYYLHDGFGRGVPYMALLKQKLIEFSPIEIFLAEKQ